MGMLDRYKKSGGIKELIKLLESSPESKKTKLIEMIGAEDQAFCLQVQSRLLDWDKLKKVKEEVLADIVATSPAPIVAKALHGEHEDFIKFCEKCIKSFSEYKEAKESVTTTPPTPDQVAGARRKMIEDARKIEADNNLQLVSDEMIKDFLAQAGHSNGRGSRLDDLAKQGGGGPAGSATEDSAPTLESFSITEPPPGLSGERLEHYFKTVLK